MSLLADPSWDEKDHRLMEQIWRTACQVLRPPPKLTVSEWADTYRYLSQESSAEPGRWNTSRAEYQRGMMDALNDPTIHTVVIMSSAQVGKTEALSNIVGYYLHQDPSPLLLVQPTLEMAETYSKDRLAPMLRDSPSLAEITPDPRSRDSGNTLLHKQLKNGAQITLAGANSPASLASRPIRVVLCDEVDRFPHSAGTEGDPVSLAFKRTTTFWNRKHILVSTPTVKGLSRIEGAWDQSDQRRFFVPCPHCGAMDYLRWSDGRNGVYRVVWEEGRSHTAHYVCPGCAGKITDADKPWMLKRGEWRATAEGVPGVAGFHLNELYSPWRRFSEIVQDFLEKKGSPEQLKVWINTSLGETWEEQETEGVDVDSLRKRLETYAADVPAGVGVLVGSVDVQDDRLECQVVGYGAGEESWLITHTQFHGDPGRAEVWHELDEFLLQTFDHESGTKLRLEAVCIDSGGHHTEQVYKFCKARFSRRIWAIKGMSQGGKEIVGRPSSNNRYRVKLFPVCVDTSKEVIYSRFKIQTPGPGYMHLPNWVDDEYLQQLTAEKSIRKYKKGRGTVREWVKIRPRNEAWDLTNYSLAALYTLGPTVVKNLAERARALIAKSKSEEKKNEESFSPSMPQKQTPPTSRQNKTTGGVGLSTGIGGNWASRW